MPEHSIRELILELVSIEDEIRRTSAGAGFGASPQTSELVRLAARERAVLARLHCLSGATSHGQLDAPVRVAMAAAASTAPVEAIPGRDERPEPTAGG